MILRNGLGKNQDVAGGTLYIGVWDQLPHAPTHMDNVFRRCVSRTCRQKHLDDLVKHNWIVVVDGREQLMGKSDWQCLGKFARDLVVQQQKQGV